MEATLICIVALFPTYICKPSKGIPNKNLTILCGKPLIEYTFSAAKESKLLDRTILSTDDNLIAALGIDNGIEVPFLRPEELAQDNSSMIDVAIHLLDYLQDNEGKVPEYLMILQPTSPLRTAKHIDEACRLIAQKEAAGAIFQSGIAVS